MRENNGQAGERNECFPQRALNARLDRRSRRSAALAYSIDWQTGSLHHDHDESWDDGDMAAVVNLDALIPREDFEVVADAKQSWRKTETLQIHELEAKRFTYNALRKPDFQRETASWGPEKIHDLVKTFLDGDLIPAVIFWESGGNIFVIDGSHRLSALIAWVQDDYGDGTRSREFFQNRIPDDQVRAADRTRALLKSSIGTYHEHAAAAEHPDRSRPEVVERARRLASLALQLQWVPAGDAKQAEDSFFKINQEATPIDPNELRILKARRSANALAARVIVRSATGHKYWQPFSQQTQSEIEKLGKEIYPLLFDPPIETPVKTLNLPIAGKSDQALPLIFDFVNLANKLPVVEAAKSNKKKMDNPHAVDADGSNTLSYLKTARDLANRLVGTHPSSLGLDPVVYFYSLAGRHQPTAFLAVANLMMQMIEKNKLKNFTSIRKDFEEFLLAHKNFVNQIVVKRGSGAKGFDWVTAFYQKLIDLFSAGKTGNEIVELLKKDPKFSFLSIIEPDAEVDTHATGKKFSRATKAQAYITEAIDKALRCSICGARMHPKSIQIDHEERRQDGGTSNPNNAKLTHPYCNSTVKG